MSEKSGSLLNCGVLFKETEPRSEAHPTHTGKLNVDGVEYRLSGWVREGANGKTFLKLAVTKREALQEPF